MKKHKIWTVLLLISMSFSMLNAFLIETNEKDHCTIQEYVQEFSQPTHCGDLCDIRYMFHISFILPEHPGLHPYDNSQIHTLIYPNKHYQSVLILPAYRPPNDA